MEITPKLIQELREKTGAGIMDCKRALAETDGDLEKGIVWLREKGIAAAAGRAGRVASEGAVGSYIHAGGKIGVLIEVNCETDFCAKPEGPTPNRPSVTLRDTQRKVASHGQKDNEGSGLREIQSGS